MLLAVVLVAVALIIVGTVATIVFGLRRAKEPVSYTPPAPRLVGPARPYAVPLDPAAHGEPVDPPAGAVTVAATPALFDLQREAGAGVSAPHEIRWSAQFDPRSGALDDIARLRLIGDLGVVASEWCIPLLAQAYVEEQRPANRQAALIALAACRSRTAAPTFRLALASEDEAARAIAADALADLEPSPKTKPRTVVERR